jgi:hypothetical protein
VSEAHKEFVMTEQEIKIRQTATELYTAMLVVQAKAFGFGTNVCDKQAKMEMYDAEKTAEHLSEKLRDMAIDAIKE